MPINYQRAQDYLKALFSRYTLDELRNRLKAKPDATIPPMPHAGSVAETAVDTRWALLNMGEENRGYILDTQTDAQRECYRANIENFIGTVKVPVGLAGPLRVNGVYAQGDYYLPLATTEAALVMSYHRGARLITANGGCTSVLLSEGVSRSPGFAFSSIVESGEFSTWVLSSFDAFREVAEETTLHGKLIDMNITIEGNHVYLNIEFTTGDASGQNMVTIATSAICNYIEAHSPVKPKYSFLEANFSGDKKASFQSFLKVRGKRVTAEVILPAQQIKRRLHTTPERMVDYWRMSSIGGVLGGTMGVQGHYANGLTALYMACGQDVACVAESAVGVTRFEITDEGALYAAVTLPNLMVATVGGGTGLPSQKAALEIMGLSGEGKARALAEVTAGLLLAGELSIIGALCSNDFARAHENLARRRKKERSSEHQ